MNTKPTLIPRSHNLEERVLAQLPAGEVINARTAADIRFFQSHPNLWVNIKANDDAQSCDDAADKRGQLGSTGVPLHKELKTVASIYDKGDGTHQIVLVHCAADERIDNGRVKEILGTQSKLKQFRTDAIPFGTFSPFLFDAQFIEEELKAHPFEVQTKKGFAEFDLSQLDEEAPYIHIFDASLTKPWIWDYMTTNFGHHNLGVQFRPHEVIPAMEGIGRLTNLVDYIENGQQKWPKERRYAIADHITASLSVEEEVALNQSRQSEYAHHKIGVITGNSLSSGVLLTDKIAEEYAALLGDDFKGDLSMPGIKLSSQPKFGHSMEMNANAHDIAEYLRQEAQGLIDDGCTIITLACNTMDVFDDMLLAMCRKAGVHYVPIHSLVKTELNEMGVTDVSILGADPVASLGRWSTYADLPERYTVHKTPDIDKVGYAVKGRKSREELLGIVTSVFNDISFGDLSRGQKAAVIVALTELSEVFNRHPDMLDELNVSRDDVAIIDTMDIYAKTIAKLAVEAERSTPVEPWHTPYLEKLDKTIQFPRVLRAEEHKPLVA